MFHTFSSYYLACDVRSISYIYIWTLFIFLVPYVTTECTSLNYFVTQRRENYVVTWASMKSSVRPCSVLLRRKDLMVKIWRDRPFHWLEEDRFWFRYPTNVHNMCLWKGQFYRQHDIAPRSLYSDLPLAVQPCSSDKALLRTLWVLKGRIWILILGLSIDRMRHVQQFRICEIRDSQLLLGKRINACQLRIQIMHWSVIFLA